MIWRWKKRNTSTSGNAARIADAIIALRDGRVDAAVLDVNLGGELVYPLAHILFTDQVPFMFITGYSGEEIEQRYANVPVLQKPIERDAFIAILGRRAALLNQAQAQVVRHSMAG